ncbi:hypothetical protein POJ06DRAFT_124813 [Lipomyces tetrasporus]|uniref:Uncharacterized protein n=1 Tax=Lipomyces tetrasporus TaxID=54092 RepID=A0AAD7VSI2_9ASCO|nr:uncharacterized protein POJ06DRAFT_124813 [Lipomyces tetrasporus]KAJ8100121.1 hypothetical protein POJ06DRAFT_124813 [Lipomyces tetrasporus]
METRGNRQNYLALNDGYDSEGLPEDQLSNPTPGPSSNPIFSQGELDSFIEISDVEVLPSDSVSESIPQPGADSSIVSRSSQDIALPSVLSNTGKKKAWFWAYFTQKEIPHEWYEKKYKKRRPQTRKSNAPLWMLVLA